ncbi:gp53-like domain-containing protein [Salmonella enterica subsp. enterica]
MVIQWGFRNSTGGSDEGRVTFPIVFPTACCSVSVVESGSGTAAQYGPCVRNISTSSVDIASADGISVYWTAYGY